jgi:superfamily II DNA or RNA helicase
MSQESQFHNARHRGPFDTKASGDRTTTASAPNCQQLAQDVIKNVIEPVSGPLGDGVRVSVSTEPLLLTLEHTAKSPKGTDYTFRYEIRLDGDKISPGPIPQLNETSHLEFLPGPHSPEMIVKMQDAFRCACVHDPVLYGRFNRKELRLEDYQSEAVEALISGLSETDRALLVLGTGGGKTQIAFEVMRRILERSPDLNEAAVAFVVNNNIILTEASDKFREVSNGALTVSRAHAGSRDTSGNIVSATPGTLIGESLLEDLIASKRQVLIVFDEVHHVVASQPDQIISRALAAAERSGTKVQFLGLTATETRPDLRSVLAYFNHHITYEKSAANLTARGFLVPFTYHAGDEWLHPKNQVPTCILPNDERATERRDLLLSPAAFPQIVNALDTHVRDREDRKTLIVAPSVHLAGELRSHLNTNDDYKGRVVRLTAEDRDTDPVRFKDTYEAWKKGRWPEGSPFAHEPVPEIVVAVDLFKEGADAPAVQTIINWADTNSLIVFLQTLGRGLRPSPFKTNLTVVDICGTFRKAHLLQYLGNASDPRNEQSQTDADRDKEGGDRDKSIPTDVRQLCELSPEVSRTVQAFVADVASCIVRRYPNYHYSALPAHEIEKLHTYLAEQCGFDSTIPFDNLLKEIGTKLTEDSSMQTVKECRHALIKAFIPADDLNLYEQDDGFHIDREDRTFLIHNHLRETMQSLVPELTPQQIARIFPEFSEETLDTVKTIGGNLATLRHLHFRLGPGQMAQELLERVVNRKLLVQDPLAETTFYAMHCSPKGASDIITSVEARMMSRSHPENGTPLGWEQRAVLLAMLHHPDIAGKLEEKDFNRTRKDFEQLLAAKGLVTLVNTGGNSDVLQFMNTILRELCTATESGDAQRVRKGVDAATPLLTGMLADSYLEENPVTTHRFRELQRVLQALISADPESSQVGQVVTLLDKLVGKMSKRQVIELSSLPRVTISAHHEPEASAAVLTISGLEKPIEVTLPICAEFAHRHIVIPSGKLGPLCKAYDSMTDIQKEEVVGTLTTLINGLVRKLPLSFEWADAQSPVIVVPTTPEGLERDLGEALLRDTELDVLTVGRSVSSNSSLMFNLCCSIDQALRSRVEDLTEESLARLRQLAKNTHGETFAKNLLHAYDVVNFARSTVALHRTQWLALFDTHTLEGESLRHVEAAREPLARLLERGRVIGPNRLPMLKAYTNILQGVVNAGGFTEETALLAATWATWDEVPFAHFDLKSSPFLSVNRDMQTFFTRMTQALQHGIELSAEDKKSAREILLTMFEATLGASLSNPPLIKELSKEAQAPALEEFKAKAIAISERIQALLASQVAPHAELQVERLNVKPRERGHPFFGADKEARVFLSGSKQKPVVHLDPECAVRTGDLIKRKKIELSRGAVTLAQLDIEVGYKERATCCKGCGMPGWRDQENYSDVAKRFRWDANTSALLPSKYETETEPEGAGE